MSKKVILPVYLISMTVLIWVFGIHPTYPSNAPIPEWIIIALFSIIVILGLICITIGPKVNKFQ